MDVDVAIMNVTKMSIVTTINYIRKRYGFVKVCVALSKWSSGVVKYVIYLCFLYNLLEMDISHDEDDCFDLFTLMLFRVVDDGVRF